MRFTTDAGVFSRGELDEGTRLLLEALPERMSGRLLDLGCGWGPVGVSLKTCFPEAEVWMTDVNLRALERSRENAERNGAQVRCLESDGFSALEALEFDAVITNPPIRAGKQVIYGIFAAARRQLSPGGALYLVIRKQQGADSAVKYLKTLFSNVETIERSGGFHVIRCREEQNDAI
ncbi:MAG: methyltransferase [Oscillospiraceae bacterium]|nr:methyltransferase [Oscillospiraceae bacterium]